MLLAGPITDGGPNQEAYKGLVEAQQLYGVTTGYTEQVKEADIATTAEGYARDGYDLIMGVGVEFASPLTELAPKFPNQTFYCICFAPEGTVPPNIGFVGLPIAEPGYAFGALAALMSTSHVIGVVGGADNPIQHQITDGFKLGAEQTVPGTKALVVITGDYNDAAKGREAATTMIGQGADVIWHVADVTGLGAIQGAVAANVKVLGAYADQSDLAPNLMGSSLELSSRAEISGLVREFVNGTEVVGKQWTPPLKDSWAPIWHDSDHNPALITDDIWTKFLQIWNDLSANKIDLSSVTGG
jgi:basic membrane protein A